MDEKLCFLVTLHYAAHDTLLQVAIQTSMWPTYDPAYPEEARQHLEVLLPLHAKVGPIVKVERLFDIVVVP